MIVEISALTKTYVQSSESIQVLKGLDLKISAGESVAIVGQSGSGKSTLLSLLAGLEHPSSGSIKVCDIDVSHMPEKKLTQFRSQHISIVFQQFHLLENLTALENISLALEIQKDPNAMEKARTALADVGLSARAMHFPATLSGGEQQRVAIARALVVKPKLLLADEPSGSLDIETGQKICDLLFDLCKLSGAAMVLVTHDLSLASRCQTVYHLHEGSLRKGPHASARV